SGRRRRWSPGRARSAVRRSCHTRRARSAARTTAVRSSRSDPRVRVTRSERRLHEWPTAPATGLLPAPETPDTARIAVDLLGGDDAPAVVVDGAPQACTADPDVHLLLVGPAGVAGEVLAALPASDRHRVSVCRVDGAGGMADPPLHGVRDGTSVRAAVAARADGRAAAMLTAGASGRAIT